MSRKLFQLTYPDGTKKHIGRAERDDLVLSGLARETEPQRYMYIGQRFTLHSLSELSVLATSFQPENLRRFLPGSFVFEHKGKRHTEMLETPEACACRLKLYDGAEA